jgi:hypothetical protein
MNPVERYRIKAAEMSARARLATDLTVRAECECLAQRYLRLAEMADVNSHTNVVYEPRPVTVKDFSLNGLAAENPPSEDLPHNELPHNNLPLNDSRKAPDPS